MFLETGKEIKKQFRVEVSSGVYSLKMQIQTHFWVSETGERVLSVGRTKEVENQSTKTLKAPELKINLLRLQEGKNVRNFQQ